MPARPWSLLAIALSLFSATAPLLAITKERAHKLQNLTNKFIYVVARGQGVDWFVSKDQGRRLMILSPKGAQGDVATCHVVGLWTFAIGEIPDRKSKPTKMYEFRLVGMDGVRHVPLHGNWNFEVTDSPLRINTYLKWCPRCAGIGPIDNSGPTSRELSAEELAEVLK